MEIHTEIKMLRQRETKIETKSVSLKFFACGLNKWIHEFKWTVYPALQSYSDCVLHQQLEE